MTSTVRRAGAFALVGTLSLIAPVVVDLRPTTLAAVVAGLPFGAVAAFALLVDDDRAVFELFARPGDRQDGTLYGLAGFALAAGGLALLAVGFDLPVPVYVGTVFLLSVGNLVANAVDAATGERVLATGGFVLGGFVAGSAGAVAAMVLLGSVMAPAALAAMAFLTATGAVLGALLRAVLFERDDPLVLVSVALALWLLSTLSTGTGPRLIAAALVVTAVLGVVSYVLDTASIPGMLTGVLLALLTMVLGEPGWFAVLIAFFGLGGLSTKFRYDEKRERGIAEPNDGARGSGNVLANSLVALVAVVGYAASQGRPAVPATPFAFAFAGAVAAALADTFSSEFGGLFDEPRLVTTFEPVAPGTDGAVTWQGELAGLVGAGVVAAVALALFPDVDATGAAVVLAAGFVGMTVDSVLGATVEGGLIGNQTVNLLATVAAAAAGVGLAWAVGIV